MSRILNIIRRFHSSGYSKSHGINILRNPHLNKEMAFTIQERKDLGIHGLLPPAIFNLEAQSNLILRMLQSMDDDLQRYTFLTDLQDRNETLFYKVVTEHTEYIMPLIYTPTVGLACQRYGFLYRRPRGLYITIHDRKNIEEILKNWHEPIVKVIVVTDGERILGLGDLGAYGMAIPVGKLSLYTGLAGVQPKHCLPIVLDVGTDNENLLNDKLYMGICHKRITDDRYDEFLDNFMKAVVNIFGNDCLVQFEDFANRNAFRVLERYRKDYCVFNDDIQGTASVAVAGIKAATHLTGRSLANDTYLFVGAGEASSGIANLLKTSMMLQGCIEKEAINRIYMMDKYGLLVKSRSKAYLNRYNKVFVRNDLEEIHDLESIVEKVKPTTIIGACGVGGIFTSRVLQIMAKNTQRPIIFSLSNPTSNSECTAEDAYVATEGKCVFASGSPFSEVFLNDGTSVKSFRPGQCNNSYIFPGVGLAIAACKIRPINDEVFIKAAECLAAQTSEADFTHGRIYPAYSEIRRVSLAIAVGVAKNAYAAGIANFLPEPVDLEEYIAAQMYTPTYSQMPPDT